MMNVTDYTNIKTLLIKFKEKSDVLYAKAAALSNYATIEWVGTQIPSVGNGTVTIKQNGTSKGSFTMNQSGVATINLTDTTYSSLSAVSGGTDKSLVTTGEKYTWNSKWDYNATTIAGVKVNNAVAADKAPWRGIIDKPTTLSGYGITDALPLNGTAANAAQLGGKAASMYFVNNTNRGAVDFDTQFINGFEYVSGLSTNGGVPYAIIYTAMYGDAGMQANFGRDSALQYRSRGGTRWFDWRTVYDDHNSNNTNTVWSAKRLATTYNLICPYTWNQKGSLTGTLVLSLPYGFNSMMQCIELSVYDYSSVNNGSRGATKFFINGYNYYSSSSRWINPFAFSIGNKNVKVRLGYYNNKCCILIGETNTTWEHPGLSVDNIYGYYANHAGTYKDDDWSCAVLQDESQITHIETASDTPLYAPCYTRAGLPYVTDNDVAAKYLKLAGGTITGSIRRDGDTIRPLLIHNYSSLYGGGWARSVLECRVDDKNAFAITPFGNYTSGATNNKIQYVSLGFGGYDGLNLRISDTSLTWGNNAIYHAGNCNLPTIPWTCSSLTVNGDINAKTSLYALSIEFSNIDFSAGHGGFIDFHFNGNTADYTSRIIEDAAGQLTLRAGTINIGTAAKCFLYLQRPSSNYIWANKTGGVLCLGTADGGETSALNSGINIIGKKVYIGGTQTGSDALNVAGVAHATTGIYTDGYISARRQDTASDIKLKKDFRKIDNALKYVLNTHYTRFRWKDDNKESIGIIAQEEQNREYGFLVQNRKEIGHLTYDYAASTALLGAAIQEEDSKVEKLRKRIIKLENELSNLKKKWQH